MDETPIKRDGAAGSSRPAVVLVHGLFLGAWAMWPLARRLAKAGFAPARFPYHTVTGEVQANAAALADFVREQAAASGGAVHCVCHSLGGLLLRQALYRHPRLPLGRTVMLGVPQRGSHVARRLARLPGFERLLECAIAHGLDGHAPRWPEEHAVHSVVGTKALGAGMLVPGLEKPHDGTVSEAETRLAAAGEPERLPVTHTSMLLSAAVADAVAAFLHGGAAGAADAA